MIRPVRDELKFVIRQEERIALLERWRRHLTRDPNTESHARTPILSQYYDSPGLRYYEEKLDGIAMRNKVRLRVYGNRFEKGCTAFLEIKQRHWDRVRKIRVRIQDFDPAYHLNPHHWDLDGVEGGAFGSLVHLHRLQRSAQIWYIREAYQSDVETDVRITFDSGLAAFHPGETVTLDGISDPSRQVMPDDLVILEVKANNGAPPWVSEGARVIELIQRPVPKYVLGVEKLRIHETMPIGAYR